MYTAIKGIYENGVLTFTEMPPPVKKSQVVVLFMDESEQSQPIDKQLRKGVFLGSLANKGYSIPEDFNDPLEDFNDYM